MKLFQPSAKRESVTVWGPTASVKVSVPCISGADDDWVLTGVSVNAQEITDVRQCFSDVSYIYALGNDQDRCRLDLQFVVFLGQRNCLPMDNLSAISDGMSSYSAHRISQRTAPSTITVGGFSASGWLVNLAVGQVNPDTSVAAASAGFIIKLR